MTEQDNSPQAAKNKKQDSAKGQGSDKGQGSGKRMWGGRFGDGPSSIMQAINASIDIDKRFAAQDIAGSKAHAAMLASVGVLTREDEADIQRGLDQIEQEILANNFTYDAALEDIHMHIESRLKEIIGDAAGRLHTARSRNDQVATDFKLWVRDTIDNLDDMLLQYQLALLDKAELFADWVMPGFTHLQTAQPVTLGHHLMAYYEMCVRDRSRLADCRKRLNTSPLGCAALAGTSFPIDREMTAKALGFEHQRLARTPWADDDSNLFPARPSPLARQGDEPLPPTAPATPAVVDPPAVPHDSHPALLAPASSLPNADHDHWGASWTGTGTGLTLVSSDWAGLFGYASAPSGLTNGVKGVGDSTDGRGVYGHAATDTGLAHGVLGQTGPPGVVQIEGAAARDHRQRRARAGRALV